MGRKKSEPTENEQLDLKGLVPDEVPVPDEGWVKLDELPADDMLLGATPSAALVESIRRFGVLEPVILAVNQNVLDRVSDWKVIDGRRRIKAARLAGNVEQMPARIFHVDASLISHVMTLILNEQRRANPVAEFAAIRRLVREGKSEGQILAATGMPILTIRRRMKLARLHGNLVEALEMGRISLAAAETALRLPEARQAELAATLAETGKLTEKQVADAKRVEASEVAKALPQSLFGGPGLLVEPGEAIPAEGEAAPTAFVQVMASLDDSQREARALREEVAYLKNVVTDKEGLLANAGEIAQTTRDVLEHARQERQQAIEGMMAAEREVKRLKMALQEVLDIAADIAGMEMNGVAAQPGDEWQAKEWSEVARLARAALWGEPTPGAVGEGVNPLDAPAAAERVKKKRAARRKALVIEEGEKSGPDEAALEAATGVVGEPDVESVNPDSPEPSPGFSERSSSREPGAGESGDGD